MTGSCCIQQLRTNKKYFFLILVKSDSGLTKNIFFNTGRKQLRTNSFLAIK